MQAEPIFNFFTERHWQLLTVKATKSLQQVATKEVCIFFQPMKLDDYRGQISHEDSEEMLSKNVCNRLGQLDVAQSQLTTYT